MNESAYYRDFEPRLELYAKSFATMCRRITPQLAARDVLEVVEAACKRLTARQIDKLIRHYIELVDEYRISQHDRFALRDSSLGPHRFSVQK